MTSSPSWDDCRTWVVDGDQLHGLGLRPVDLATVREVATRVALRVGEDGHAALMFMDHDRAH